MTVRNGGQMEDAKSGRPRASCPVGSASIILGKVDSGRFFYFFLTRSEPFIEFSSPLELIKLFMSSQSRHLASLLASIRLRSISRLSMWHLMSACRKRCGVRSSKLEVRHHTLYSSPFRYARASADTSTTVTPLQIGVPNSCYQAHYDIIP